MARKINRWFHPHNNIGYRAEYSPAKNYEIGMRNNVKGERNSLVVARQLQALANVNERRDPAVAKSFRESAEYAFRKHREGK
ncbi:MAG: hypothetical protein QXU98_08430 [Candidatus Parvarchaeota archaeon]